MLLELHDVNRSLRSAGIAVGATDNRIQTYPNRQALEVYLTEDGRILRAALLSKEQLDVIRKFECSTGGLRESTPGFNVDPLYRVKPDANNDVFEKTLKELKKATKTATVSMEGRKTLVQTLRSLCEPNWDCSDKSKVSQCLAKAARTLRGELEGAGDRKLEPLLELLKRSVSLSARGLLEEVAEALIRTLTSGETGVPLDDCIRVLFSSRGSDKKKTSSGQSFSLILELSDWSSGGPANHETVWDAVNSHLVTSQSAQQAKSPTKVRSGAAEERVGIFGEAISGPLGTMPERNLPRLGKVKLFSLSAQTPCQQRYGLIESDACPVGPEVQTELASALQWITEKEREDKTWADVSDSCGYKKQSALLVAYVTKMPTVPPAASALFARPSATTEEIDIRNEDRFEVRAKSLIGSLRGLMSHNPGLSVAVLVIAKADSARKKLLYSQQIRVERLVEAAELWQLAARNHPPVPIRSFDSARRPFWQNPWTPYPSDVVAVINTFWDAKAEEPKRISNARLGLGLALLLETDQALREVARETLRLLVQSVVPLVLALARSHQEGRVFTVSKSCQDIPLLVPATLGLALWKAGHLKGTYMKSNPYLIGRLLSLADELHRNYCRHERRGELPSRLIGNALMPTALERPVTGLARLAERLVLYQAVASKELRSNVWTVEESIDKASLPAICSDEDKAQMLLGYLARPELEEDPVTEEPDTNKENAP